MILTGFACNFGFPFGLIGVIYGSLRILIGVQKERMVEEDMYVLSSSGSILSAPLAKPYPHKPPKCSDCAPLFLKVFILKINTGIVNNRRQFSLVCFLHYSDLVLLFPMSSHLNVLNLYSSACLGLYIVQDIDLVCLIHKF